MSRTRTSDNNRGQAYTLEGLIGAMIVLMAVLFAMQSAVITPSTGGSVDRTVQAQIQQETQDALVVAATNDSENDSENLSHMVRHWDGDGFANADGSNDPENREHRTYTVDGFEDQFVLGAILAERFDENGRSYNVEVHSVNGHDDHRTLVYQGQPPSSAVTASYTVALYENQTVTAGDDDGEPLENASENGTPPIQNTGDDPLYNVVEVRVIVW